jgi:hypothetical protein
VWIALLALGCEDRLVADVERVELGTMSVSRQPEPAWVSVLNTRDDALPVDVSVDHPFLDVDLVGSSPLAPDRGLLLRVTAVREAQLFPTTLPGTVLVSGDVEPLAVTVDIDVECDLDGDGLWWWRCGGEDCDDADPLAPGTCPVAP